MKPPSCLALSSKFPGSLRYWTPTSLFCSLVLSWSDFAHSWKMHQHGWMRTQAKLLCFGAERLSGETLVVLTGVVLGVQVSAVSLLTSVCAAVILWHSQAFSPAPMSLVLFEPWHGCESSRNQTWCLPPQSLLGLYQQPADMSLLS